MENWGSSNHATHNNGSYSENQVTQLQHDMYAIKNTMVTFQTNFHTFQETTENETSKTQNQLVLILAAIQSNNQTVAPEVQ